MPQISPISWPLILIQLLLLIVVLLVNMPTCYQTNNYNQISNISFNSINW